jgi:hypothetical protein
MGLQARSARQQGDRLQLRLRLSPEDPPLELEAETVWCAKETDLTPGMHYYEMGLRFVSLSQPALSAITAFVDSDAHFWPDEETLTGF